MRPTPRASSSWCSRYDAARELIGGRTGYATSLSRSLSREDDAGGVGYGCGFGEGVELSERGDGLRRVVSVALDSVGETVGSRDDTDADADGDDAASDRVLDPPCIEDAAKVSFFPRSGI